MEATEPQDPVALAEARVEEAEAAATDAPAALDAARGQFCADAESYLEAVDRYGKLFTDDAATVGDVETLGADLVEPRETVSTSVDEVAAAATALTDAEQELADAEAALAAAIATASSVPTSSTTPATTTTTTLVPQATIERVEQAEDDLAEAGEGITSATPLAEASAEYNSAAFALQIAWLRLFADAGCLDDEQHAEAVEQVTSYTSTLQTELQRVGYYEGAIDGIYGPATVDAVKRLQADSDLAETGFVDRATAGSARRGLAELDLQTAATDLTHTASVQTVLSANRLLAGPIDGVWTDELTAPSRSSRRRSVSSRRASWTRRRWLPSNRRSPSHRPGRPRPSHRRRRRTPRLRPVRKRRPPLPRRSRARRSSWPTPSSVRSSPRRRA